MTNTNAPVPKVLVAYRRRRTEPFEPESTLAVLYSSGDSPGTGSWSGKLSNGSCSPRPSGVSPASAPTPRRGLEDVVEGLMAKVPPEADLRH